MDFLGNIQVSPEALPPIRQAYLADVGRYIGGRRQEKVALETALQRLEQKELNLWRAFTDHGMRPQVYEQLAREYQAERERIAFALKTLQQENREYIANLDAALQVIAEIQARYMQQDVHHQRAILRHGVGKVVIDERGRIIRLELQPPFTYLRTLAGENGRPQRKREKRSSGQRSRPKKTKSSTKAGCSLEVSFCDPNGLCRLCFTLSCARCHCVLTAFLFVQPAA